METSILIAQIIAIVYLSFGVGILISGDYYKKELIKFFDNSPCIIIGGIFAIVCGSLIIHFHNIWVANWTVLITILGWLAVIKGISLIAFPKTLMMFKPMFEAENLYKILAPIIILLGLVFGYLGFL